MRMQKEIIEIQSSLHKLAYDGRQLAFDMQGESKLHYYGVTSEALTHFYLVADQVKSMNQREWYCMGISSSFRYLFRIYSISIGMTRKKVPLP